jgi:hypothetical protein
VVYLPHGGAITLDLTAVKSRLFARWFNPRTGTFLKKTNVPQRSSPTFRAPDSSDWALELQQLDYIP